MIKKIVNMAKTMVVNNLKNEKKDYSIWVFSSSYNTKFNYNSKYLFEYILKNKPNIMPLYVINDDVLRNQLQKRYGEKYFIETKSLKGIKKVLNSGVWLTSAGLPVYGSNLNKERIIINLWHGIPLKKIALLEENISKVNQLYFKYLFSNNYTYILTTSKKLINVMRKSFGVAESKIKVWGQPRNDAIFKKNNKDDILNCMYNDLPRYKNIILYAPTYRDKRSTEFFPFEDFSENELDSFLEENQLIMFIRCHQAETKNINIEIGNRIRLINADKIEDIMDIINIFDLLITDYSSIYIDYLLTEKPIMFLPYDKEEYLKQRGMNFDYDSVTPGPKPKTFVEFKNELLNLFNDKDYYYPERHKINRSFNKIMEPCSEIIYENIIKEINQYKNGN